MVTDSQRKANLKYAKTHLKRVPLDLQIKFYEEVKKYCDDNNYTVNGLIKELLLEKIKSN